MSVAQFQPAEPLIPGVAGPRCHSVIILPARDEEHFLPAALTALSSQVNGLGEPIDSRCYEVIVLLNNCSDRSMEAASAWRREHPDLVLHVVERVLPPDEAHVGTARRLLMDTAWSRLRGCADPCAAILSTDADTRVAPGWLWETRQAMKRRADAVGGAIDLDPGGFEELPPAVRRSYRLDEQYARLVAELEDLLDPQPGDPWPRHLQHFGASLACTAEAYARAGGLKPASPLEDVLFVDALRRVDARLRHEPRVRVTTSARLRGRVETGLSGQLRLWNASARSGETHTVPTAAWLAHRFRMLAKLRSICAADEPCLASEWPAMWQNHILQVQALDLGAGEFLAQVDCDRLIHETFRGVPVDGIERVIADLSALLHRLRSRESMATMPGAHALQLAR